MGHQLPDALGVEVVLAFRTDLQEVVDLLALDVSRSALAFKPVADQIRPRIHEVVVAVSGEDAIHLLISAPRLETVLELPQCPGPDGVPGIGYPLNGQLLVADGHHHESGGAGVVRQRRLVRRREEHGPT